MLVSNTLKTMPYFGLEANPTAMNQTPSLEMDSQLENKSISSQYSMQKHAMQVSNTMASTE